MSAATTTLAGRQVNRVGMSCLSLTGPGAWGEPVDRTAALALLRQAAETGTAYFDTAEAYGPGISEELIAEALAPFGQEILVGTKAGFTRRGPDDWTVDASPASLRASCDRSLRRLRVDHLDLFQLHTPDPSVPLEDSVGALAQLRQEGKVRAIGVCNLSVAELDFLLGIGSLDTVMVGVRDQRAELASLLERCRVNGLIFLHWPRIEAGGELERAVASVAADLDAPVESVTVAWLLRSHPAFLPLPGARSTRQQRAVRQGATLHLADEQVRRLDDIYWSGDAVQTPRGAVA